MATAAAQAGLPGRNRSFSPVWGPFTGPGDTLNHVGAFINRTLSANVGICWVGGGGLHPLRAPHYDGNGFGEIAIVEWRNLPKPPPRPHAPATFWGKVKAALNAYFEQQGQAALLQSKIAMAQGQMINNALGTLYKRAFSDKHRSDTEGVLLDALAIGLTIGFVAGPWGWIALGGGLVLLLADGAAWGLEMAGDDETAEWLKEADKPIRWIAIAAAIPDAVYGLAKVFRELPEVGRTVAELRAGKLSSTSTSARATADAERVGREASAVGLDAASQARKADFARRYEAIAARAQQRAADHARKLSESWAKLASTTLHEVTPRLTVPETLRLMYGEFTPAEKKEAVDFMKHYMFHVVSVHR